MRLVLGGVGRLKAGPERELCDRYVSRVAAMSRQAGIAGVEAWDVEEARSRAADQRKRDEAASLASRLAPGTRVVVFDEHGRGFTSQDFAAMIGRARDAGTPSLAVLIGGPDGFDPAFRAQADLQYSFGTATLPHQLVRILAAEQIYRALTILTGHPYHRA